MIGCRYEEQTEKPMHNDNLSAWQHDHVFDQDQKRCGVQLELNQLIRRAISFRNSAVSVVRIAVGRK